MTTCVGWFYFGALLLLSTQDKSRAGGVSTQAEESGGPISLYVCVVYLSCVGACIHTCSHATYVPLPFSSLLPSFMHCICRSPTICWLGGPFIGRSIFETGSQAGFLYEDPPLRTPMNEQVTSCVFYPPLIPG